MKIGARRVRDKFTTRTKAYVLWFYMFRTYITIMVNKDE